MHITREDMTAHINAGRAEEWTHALAGMMPTAARMDDAWYVILDGTDNYQPAPQPLADILTTTHALLATADATLAQADTPRRP